ncbi:MAG: M24 family metallopeptidase [Gemmatimonadetes bacterium]|nr:aminopeptidase P family protein [Gemmatimonadota bacterium]NIR79053.1 aminopeptidase P family protein [Gemmatimonadota bacterium]NIT87710.1 aminopeptidase P family protein [Gemmatimonadota bacterium]NIU31571.1 aminopeptidase P family protein [Gemmatimonadota bacterium]NIU36227.1 M24 family metallopeptidase [Gemmatimonadota bacterium]
MRRTRDLLRRSLSAVTLLLAAGLSFHAGGWTPLAPDTLAAQTPEQSYADWARPIFPAGEYSARREALLEALETAGGGILLVPSSDGVTHGETFRQLDDFWYLAGVEVPGSMLALDSDRGASVLFLPRRDPRFERPGRPNDFPGRPLGDDPSVAASAGVERTADVQALGDSISAWVGGGRRLRVNAGRPGHVRVPEPPLVGTLGPVESLVLRLDRDHPELEVGNAFSPIARLRMRKSPTEVDAIERAARATTAAIRETAAAVRPGVDESTLRGVFEAACRREGAQAIPFTPIVKSGANALWPWRILAAHYERRSRALETGEIVILDVGCEVDGYVSDLGRTFPVGGAFDARRREKLEMVNVVAERIIAAVRPGVTLVRLTEVAYEAIPDPEERYMQTPSYFGHHIGLSAGDPALFDEPLAPGMVFTVEPWYYNHDLEISVFVEDVVLVTEDGVRVLTASLPRSPDALEAIVP